jgi:AAA domain
MSNTFRLLQNVGQFDSVSSGAALPLAELALGYAENGRGKTTLSAILRSLSTNDPLSVRERHRLGANHPPRIIVDCAGGPPHAIFENGAWNRYVADIAIFDDAFVDQNICSGLAIDASHRQRLHEFILGSQGVALNDALRQHIENIEAHTRALRELGNAIPETARFGVPAEQFCSLPANPAIEDAIREAERAVAAAGQQDAIRTTDGFKTFALPLIDAARLASLLGQTIDGLDQMATLQVQQHFAVLGRGGEAWVENGITRIHGGLDDPGGKPCPFCAQDLDESALVLHYRSYFAAAYAEHKRLLDHAARQFSADHSNDAQLDFSRVGRLLFQTRAFWSQFTEIPEIDFDIDTIHAAWTTARDAVNQALEAKRAAPLDRIELSADALRAIDAYHEHAAGVAALSDRLMQTKAAIDRVKERAATANVAALQRDLSVFQAVRSRHAPAIAPLCDDYESERQDKMAAEAARDAARAALDQYRTNIFPAYQLAINDCLRRFNAGFRLDSVASNNTRAGSSCTYNVLINNQTVAVSAANPAPGAPSFKTTLSAGDRTRSRSRFSSHPSNKTPRSQTRSS